MRYQIIMFFSSLGGAALLGQGFWQNIASLLGSAASVARRKAEPERDAVEELTDRLRHPVLHAIEHPMVTVKRKLDRRRSL